MLGRELARELQKPPLGYISVPRVLPQLTHLSLASFGHQDRPISPEFASVHHGRLGLGMIPAKPSLPSSFRYAHRVPLIPLSSPPPCPSPELLAQLPRALPLLPRTTSLRKSPLSPRCCRVASPSFPMENHGKEKA